MQWCENSPDPQVWEIPGASIRGHQSRAPICSHCLQAGKSLAACGGAAAVLPQPRWELGWAGLGIAKHPSCTFKSRPFGMGFHLLQGFGEGNTEREHLTYVAVCTWSPRAGDGSLAMPRLVSGAAPSQFGVSQSPRGTSYKAALLMSQTPGRKMHPGTPVTRAAIGVWRAVSAWGSQAAPLPSLMAQAAEDILR